MKKYRKLYLTPHDIAEELHLNVVTVYNFIRKKKLAAILIGKNYRIDQTDFRKFIESNKLK